jgi:hypothetical protein
VFLANHWPYICTAAGGAGVYFISLWASLHAKEWTWKTWTAATVLFLLSLAGGISTWLRQRLLTSLEHENDRLRHLLATSRVDYFEQFRVHLQLLAEALDLTGTDRISVYKHEKDHFVILGRFSSNLNYAERRRPLYAEEQGCISEAWKKGKSHEYCLPDPQSKLEQYLTKVEQKWRIPRAVCADFNMKSRCLAAYRIDNRAATSRLAVIVFESTKCNRFDKEQLEIAMEFEGRRIAHLIETMNAFEPDPRSASQEGF